MLTSDGLKRMAAPAAIALAALLAFGLTLRMGFMWDDHRMIEENPRISMTAGNLAAAFKGDPFSQGLNYYRPLQTVSNMADFAVWGLRPAGYRLTNLVFHAAAAILVFYLALALGFPRRAAFWACVLLAAHPSAVEQLLVIAGRAELASGACIAASLLLLVKGRAAWSFLLFAAACGFKENGVITPALAALCLWYLGRPRRDYLKLLPFAAFIPLYLLLRYAALGMGPFSHGLAPAVSGLFLKVPAAVLLYLKDAFLPFWMHSHRMQPDPGPLVYAALPVLAAACLLIWRRAPKAAVLCAAWYLLNLAPKFPLLAANDLMLDHWVYLSNAGLFLGVAWLAERGKILAGPLPAMVAAGLAAASVYNAALRDTDLRIYEHAALRSSSKPMLYNLAREYYRGGRFMKSRLLLERISAADPGNALYLNGLALARWKDGDAPGALAALDGALALKPGDPETLYNRYTVLQGTGREREAAAAIKELLSSSPGYAPALLVLARYAAGAGRTEEAGELYRRILAAAPYDLEALNDYGVLLARRGDSAGAEALFRRALRAAPGLESARRNLERLEALRAGGGGY